MAKGISSVIFLLLLKNGACIDDYGQPKTLCGYGGSRENCDPILANVNSASVAEFIDPSFTTSTCFLTQTSYSVQPDCKYLKHYGNGVITFATGGIYQYTDSQSSRHQYQRGDIEYQCGGGGGTGIGHSQGITTTADGTVVQDFFVMRKADQSLNRNQNNGPHHDWYELKSGVYKFGYYDCDRIVEGGAIDDYQYHYFCSSGYDLYSGCVAACGLNMADYTSFNFTSTLFGEVDDTATSQIFS